MINSPEFLNLPAPDALARAHSERVAELIRREIHATGGQISFARYMELALYSPGLGYYSAGAQKFGEAGDFITAPELSPLFARCLARQCQEILSELHQADILELGAGSGVLAAELLQELEKLKYLPERYFVLELSADLRARQQQLLSEKIPELYERIVWLDGLPSHGFRGIVIANEVLDAMPVHRFQLDAQGMSECFVASQDNSFVWRTKPLSDPALRQRIQIINAALETHGEIIKPGYQSEINLAAEAWLSSMAERLESGLILIIDYGFPQREYYHPDRNMGTLMCHYRHYAHPDPFILPGLQDITSHVDFTALAEAAYAAGLDISGYTTQAHFLIGCGLTQMTDNTTLPNTRQRLNAMQQIKKLTLPSEMGELFKVAAFTRGVEHALCGFSVKDLRGRL
jgi:SAM-dependent MidA family methyltransferase